MSGTTLLVRGGTDVTGRRCDLRIVDGRVAEVGDAAGRTAAGPHTRLLDATGLVVSPGWLDLQVNGAGGIDVTTEPERLWEVGAMLARHGVTAFAPTVITSDASARDQALAALRAGRPPGVPEGAVPVGLHLEGPMLAASHRGAHPQARLRMPSAGLVEGWSRDAGVLIVTLAPELPGALDVIRDLVARGVVVSLGHTAATAAQTQAALDAGATALTHLCNAMPPLHHREPGPVGVALGGATVVAGLISDGHHVDPLVLRTAFRALGPERLWAVSDTTAALGLPDGTSRLGDSEVVIAGGTVRLLDGTLAGSAASLRDCLEVLLRVTGCSLAEAVATATSTPARLVRDSTRGRLAPGARGDLVLLDREAATGPLRVVATVVGGRLVHDVRDGAA